MYSLLELRTLPNELLVKLIDQDELHEPIHGTIGLTRDVKDNKRSMTSAS